MGISAKENREICKEEKGDLRDRKSFLSERAGKLLRYEEARLGDNLSLNK